MPTDDLDRDGLLSQLTICYSALAERVQDIRPPVHPGIEVIVLVQGEDVGSHRLGPEVTVRRLASRGVARSRNAAIDAATRRYLLFCDDDVTVDLDGVAAGIERLRTTGAAVGLGRGVDPSGALRKRYAADGTPLTLTNSGRAATYEMLVDVEQVRRAGTRFDERFGAGAQYYLGDEYIFIADALRAGLRGVAVARVFGVHPARSSGTHWGTPGDRHARAVVVNRVFGRRALPARVAFAVRHRSRIGLRGALPFVLDRTRPTGAPGSSGAVAAPRRRPDYARGPCALHPTAPKDLEDLRGTG